MAKYIYLPIASMETASYASSMRKAFNIPVANIRYNPHNSGIRKGWLHSTGRGCLNDLKPRDTLYVIAHSSGNPGHLEMGANRDYEGSRVTYVQVDPTHWEWQGGKKKVYRPEQFAKTLSKEGLPRNFVNLHICSCSSGLGYTGMSSWAYRLRQAMRKKYPDLQVTGYTGLFTFASRGIYVESLEDHRLYPYESRAVVFS